MNGKAGTGAERGSGRSPGRDSPRRWQPLPGAAGEWQQRQRHSDARVTWKKREKGMRGENPSVCKNHRKGYFLSVKLN